MYVKQSTARSFLFGPILDADGVAKTDEVVASMKVTKNGTVGAANGSSTLTHNHTGHYVYAGNPGDFDTLGVAEFSLNSTTNAASVVRFQVVPANVFDSLVSGSDLVDVSAVQFAGQTISASAGVTVPASIGTGTSTLDAAGVRTAVGLASANLDTQLDALPTAAENAAAVAARNEVLKILSFASGKVAKSGSAYTYYAADGSTVLFTLTIADASRTPS